MTELPKSIRVGPLTYTVEVMPKGLKGGEWGMTHHTKLRIRLDGRHPQANLRATLLHEVLHAARYVTGAHLEEFAKHYSKRYDLEERVITTLEHPLLGILRDNPDLVAFLTAGE